MTEPNQPSAPDQPAAPDQPVEPDQPAGSGQAGGPDQPSAPHQPAGSGQPAEPGQPDGSGPSGGPAKPSGLRNPARAIRGVGAGGLVLQAIVLLLALVPLARLGGTRAAPAIWFCLALVVVAILFAGMLGRSWAWWGAALIPGALVVGGFFLHWSLAALGVLFGLLWAYVLHVRRTILG